jgi:hypothetical protein
MMRFTLPRDILWQWSIRAVKKLKWKRADLFPYIQPREQQQGLLHFQ